MLYIHIPFCHQKCTYCAFYSSPSTKRMKDYVDTLCIELAERSYEQDSPLRTVYFGGGTPSMLPIELLEQIIDNIKQNYDCSLIEEATLETNPEDLTNEYLERLANLKYFNRLSIGIQSFQDKHLKMLNRRHNGNEAIEAVRNAYDYGFRNISVDLIFGLPEQTNQEWIANLSRLDEIESHISHLSGYALSVEPNTMLAKQIESKKLETPDEDSVLFQYNQLQQWIKAKGWHQYEISSYCKNGCKSKHNSRYWDRTPYIGVGAAAHSFDGEHRRWNVSSIDDYINGYRKGAPNYEKETLTAIDAYNEYIMTALRTCEGINTRKVAQEWPTMQQKLSTKVQKYIDSGLLICQLDFIQPTENGLLQADGIATDLFED